MNMMFAYIDPFTGTLLIQVLGMAFMSLLIFFKKVKAFVLGIFGAKGVTEQNEDTRNTQDAASVKLYETDAEEKKAA